MNAAVLSSLLPEWRVHCSEARWKGAPLQENFGLSHFPVSLKLQFRGLCSIPRFYWFIVKRCGGFAAGLSDSTGDGWADSSVSPQKGGIWEGHKEGFKWNWLLPEPKPDGASQAPWHRELFLSATRVRGVTPGWASPPRSVWSRRQGPSASTLPSSWSLEEGACSVLNEHLFLDFSASAGSETWKGGREEGIGKTWVTYLPHRRHPHRVLQVGGGCLSL